MPNKDKHLPSSALCSGLASLFFQLKNDDFSFLRLCASTAIGATAGMAPDAIEPATDPNHRKFFHSKLALLLDYLGALTATQVELDDYVKEFILAFTVGYGIHLLLDAGTSELPSY